MSAHWLSLHGLTIAAGLPDIEVQGADANGDGFLDESELSEIRGEPQFRIQF